MEEEEGVGVCRWRRCVCGGGVCVWRVVVEAAMSFSPTFDDESPKD